MTGDRTCALPFCFLMLYLFFCLFLLFFLFISFFFIFRLYKFFYILFDLFFKVLWYALCSSVRRRARNGTRTRNPQLGRAGSREREKISVSAASLRKKTKQTKEHIQAILHTTLSITTSTFLLTNPIITKQLYSVYMHTLYPSL